MNVQNSMQPSAFQAQLYISIEKVGMDVSSQLVICAHTRHGEMNKSFLGFSILVYSVAAATSQEWQQFGIKRFGFIFDVPPGFELTQRSDNGDGAAFHSADGALLAVWGINLENSQFLAEIKSQISRDEKEGWQFTYRRLTRKSASYSGIRVIKSAMSEPSLYVVIAPQCS